MEVAAILAFVAIVIIGAILGLVAYWKVRKVQNLPAQILILQEEIQALRNEIASHRFSPDEAAASSPSADPATEPRQPTPDPTSEPPGPAPDSVEDGAEAPETDAKSGDEPTTPPQADEEKIAARSAADPMTAGYSPQQEPASAASAQGTPRAKPKQDIESTVGALWAVWVGGIALALGGIFLVRYSIEQGWLGPLARVSFGLVFGALLGGLGEWTRRRGQAFAFAGFEKANIPAILTAAGTVATFASVYAAYALYDLISPATAFVALGAVGVASLAAALLHGVLLATVGLIGSYCVPLLVSTNEPNPLALAIYILVVSAAAFGVARMRLWRWLAIAAAAGLFVWGLILLSVSGSTDRFVVFGYIFASLALVYGIFVASLYPREPKRFLNTDIVATGVLATLLLLLLGAILFHTYDALSILVLMLAIAACFGAAYYYSAVRYVILAGMLVVVPGYLGWSVPLDDLMLFTDSIGSTHGVSTPILENIRQNSDAAFIWTGLLMGGLAAGLGLFGTLRSAGRALLAVGGSGLPIMLVSVAYVRLHTFEPSALFGIVALALGLGLGTVANRLFFQLPKDAIAREEAISAYAIAAISGMALALAFVLERGALTIALALVVPATALVYARRPLTPLRPVAVIIALLWVARIAWDPRIVGDELGTFPVFNWLLYGYGVPAAGFAAAAWLLGRDRRDVWLEILEAIAIASFATTIALVGLHAVDPAEVFTAPDSLAEATIFSLVSGGVALGLLRITRTRTSRTMDAAVTILGYAGMAIAGFGLLFVWNPLLTGEQISQGLIFNQLTFAYLVSSVLYAVLALTSRGKRPVAYSYSAASLSFILFATWVTLTIRHAFHPEGLDVGRTLDAELYTYSIVWLVIGLIVLLAGIWSGLRPVRLLSGAILIGVVAKVFLVDMANLTGVLRALSFIGLGIVLIGIGLLYQRLLRTPTAPEPDEDEPTDGAETRESAP